MNNKKLEKNNEIKKNLNNLNLNTMVKDNNKKNAKKKLKKIKSIKKEKTNLKNKNKEKNIIKLYNKNKKGKRKQNFMPSLEDKTKKSLMNSELNKINLSKKEPSNLELINNPEEKNNSNKLFKLKIYNDYELNILTYEKALKIDKRTYIEYYFSLLKKTYFYICLFK